MTGLPAPDAPRVLAVVQAGGQGSRMDVLTRERAKPALPFAGSYQLVDLALSSIANSGVDDVWVSVQYMAGSLDTHLQSGRPWDLDRTRGGYRRLVPEEGRERTGFSSGTADDLSKIADEIASLRPDVVVVLSADQVFRVDLRAVVAQHRRRGSVATVVTVEVPRHQAAHKALVTADATGLVRRVEEKPEHPDHGVVSAEILVFSAPQMLATLQQVRHQRATARASERGADEPPATDSGLGDLAEDLLPHLVETGPVHTFALDGYWQDMGRPAAYLEAHQDLVHGRVDVFDDPDWPMRSNQPDLAPARLRGTARVTDSVLSAGCDVAGTVRRSCLGPGVVVEEGALVEDSVLFARVVLERGAAVRTTVLDDDVRVGRDARVGSTPRGRMTDERVTLVGRESTIAAGARVAGGSRLEPGTSA